MMLWFPGKRRLKALSGRVETLSRQVSDTTGRIDGLVAELARLSSTLAHACERLDRQASDRHKQSDRLSSLHDQMALSRTAGEAASSALADLQDRDRATSEALAALRTDGASLSVAVEEQAVSIDDLRSETVRHYQSFDQVRADLTRLERQTAIDVADLRKSDLALTRALFGAQRRVDGNRTDGNRAGPIQPRSSAGSSTRRLHEAADELPAPEGAISAIVEEEPAER